MDHVFDPTRPVYLIGDPTIDQNLLQPLQHIAVDGGIRYSNYTTVAFYARLDVCDKTSFWRWRRHEGGGRIYTTLDAWPKQETKDSRIELVSLKGKGTYAQAVHLARELGAKHVVVIAKLTKDEIEEIQNLESVYLPDPDIPKEQILNEQALSGGPFFMAESQPSSKKQKKEK